MESGCRKAARRAKGQLARKNHGIWVRQTRRVAAFCPAQKLHHYGCIGNNSGSSALGWNTEGRKQHMKIARINRHIARPVLGPAKRSRIESKRRKVVYFLYAGGLEPLRYPYTD